MSLSHYLSFARSMILRDRPVYAHFAVTDQCDLRCRACSIWKREASLPLLDLAGVERLAEMLAGLGCVQVSLGGGEPSLREDLPEIVKIMQSRGLRTRVLTNGVAMTPDIARKLLDAGLSEVSFSLDSLDRKTQEHLDGAKGSFDKRVDNLMWLAKNLPESGAAPILNTMATRQNLDQLLTILALAERLGFYSSFIPIHLTEDANDHRFFGADQSLGFSIEDEAQVRGVFAELALRKKLGARVINSTKFLKGAADYLITGQSRFQCHAGSLYISISPEGMVAPCHAFEGQFEAPFDRFPAMLADPEYKKTVREKIAGCEGCYRPCWTEVSYMVNDGRSFLEMAKIQLGKGRRRPAIDEESIRGGYFSGGKGGG